MCFDFCCGVPIHYRAPPFVHVPMSPASMPLPIPVPVAVPPVVFPRPVYPTVHGRVVPGYGVGCYAPQVGPMPLRGRAFPVTPSNPIRTVPARMFCTPPPRGAAHPTGRMPVGRR